MKQVHFGFINNYRAEFGGSLLKKGGRKTQRPLSTKCPIHLVLKSSERFRLFNPRNKQVDLLLRRQAARFQIQIFDFAVNWSHIHLLIQIPDRKNYVAFIRSFTAQLVRLFAQHMAYPLKGLFELRPYTKILSWGRQFKNAFQYQKLNQLEAAKLITRLKSARVNQASKTLL